MNLLGLSSDMSGIDELSRQSVFLYGTGIREAILGTPIINWDNTMLSVSFRNSTKDEGKTRAWVFLQDGERNYFVTAGEYIGWVRVLHEDGDSKILMGGTSTSDDCAMQVDVIEYPPDSIVRTNYETPSDSDRYIATGIIENPENCIFVYRNPSTNDFFNDNGHAVPLFSTETGRRHFMSEERGDKYIEFEQYDAETIRVRPTPNYNLVYKIAIIEFIV